MEKLINYFKSRKYTLSLFAGLFLVLIIFLIVLSFFFPDYRNSTSTNFSNFLFSPLQKTQIGITTGKDLDKIPIIKKEQISNTETKYTVKSANPLKSDEIITKNGIVIYEKTSTFTEEKGGFPKLSEYIKKYGQPEAKLIGSKAYGPFVETYVYSNKGFAVIGYPLHNDVYEIQRFIPMSVDEYKKNFGQDIRIDIPKDR